MQYTIRGITIIVYIVIIYVNPLLHKIVNWDIFNKEYFCHRYLMLFLIVVLLNRKILSNDFKLIKKISFESLIIEWVLMFVGYIFLCLILANILPANMNEMNVASYNTSIAMILIKNCFGPITEDIVFRVSISNCFKKEKIGIIVSAILFGILHTIDYCIVYNDWSQLLWSLPYIFFGIVIGLIYKKHKNVYAVFLCHMFINWIATVGG